MCRKRVRIDTNFQPTKKKCAERSFVGNDDDDRISQLPDDILVDILSLLSLKEAGRTSVLSSRWINMWKHTPSLDFDRQISFEAKLKESMGKGISLEELEKLCKLPKSERRKYTEWVNSVIQSHKSPTLKQFRLRYALDTSDKNSITRWLQFASSRQVQSLVLHCCVHEIRHEKYRFPEELFAPISTAFDFKRLKELYFKHVNVSGGSIESFLRNCPRLEKLSVHSPGKLSKLEVCGSSLVLKHLEIVCFSGLESLKVSAPSLTSLGVASLNGVLLENVPMLVDVSVACEAYGPNHLKHLIFELSCRIPQLETLKLVLRTFYSRQETNELFNYPDMPKLKKLKLVIEYSVRDDETLIRLASLTRASPYLQEFVLENIWHGASCGSRKVDYEARVDDEATIVRFRHEHLKVFKFCGYYGNPSDDALVRYILENCVVLEKIVIDPSPVCFHEIVRRSDVEEAARKKAKQHFEPLLPNHVELVIL